MKKQIIKTLICALAAVSMAGVGTGNRSVQAQEENETPWYLSDGLSKEDNVIIGIEDGGEYPDGEKINFYAAGADNNTSILHPKTPSYVPYKYEITGTDNTGRKCEYREREFDRDAHVLGTIPALEPGEYMLKVFFRRRVWGSMGDGYAGEDIAKEVEFRITDKKEMEEEIISVEIDSFLVDDAHIRVVDLIAKELGMRLKIHGLTDNTGGGRSESRDKIDEMLQEGEVDIAVGHTFSESTPGIWDHNLACSRTYLPKFVVFAKKDSGITELNDLAGKTVYIREFGDTLGGVDNIWIDFWDSVEGETVYYEIVLDKLKEAFLEGKADAIVVEEYDASDIQDWDVRLLPETVLDNGYMIAASWENEALIEKIDQAIDRLEESGELQKVMDMHFGWKKE